MTAPTEQEIRTLDALIDHFQELHSCAGEYNGRIANIGFEHHAQGLSVYVCAKCQPVIGGFYNEILGEHEFKLFEL